MFSVYLYDGGTIPEDEICYIITKNGPYMKKKLGLIESIAPVKNISILDELKPYAKMEIPKIPAHFVASTITFFKAVYNLHRSESIVLIFYNEETQDYQIIPPYQKVNSAALDYTKSTLSVPGYSMIGTIHSHANFGAFHSGTDHKDEESFDGIHITFGNVLDENFSISASIVSNGFRVLVDPVEYLEGIELTQREDVRPGYKTWKWDPKLKKSVPSESKPIKTFNPRYKITLPTGDLKYPKSWLKKVEYKTPTYNSKYYRSGKWYNRPGVYFNWDDYGYPGFYGGPQEVKGSPLNVGPCKAPKFQFPNHDVDDEDFNPCVDCVFRDYKIEWALEQFTEEVDDDELEEVSNNFTPAVIDEVDKEAMIARNSLEDDDGSLMYKDPDELVKEQFESEDYLGCPQDGPMPGEPIPDPDDLPPNLVGKPFSWIREWLNRRGFPS